MRRWPLVCVAAAAASIVTAQHAQAGPPQCGDGHIVMAGCTAPGDCTAVIDDQCVGQVPALLPPPPPVRIGIEGGVGVG
jgi:hypothetical protein